MDRACEEGRGGEGSGKKENDQKATMKAMEEAMTAAKKAEKAEKAKANAADEKGRQKTTAGGGDGQQASTSVINYTYFDTARRDTLIPIQKRKALTAKDIMDKDAEARQDAQQPRK